MSKIPFYPGCALQTTARNYLISGVAVAKKLGIELFELPKWNCCGVFPYLATDDIMRHLAPIRNLIHAQELNESNVRQKENRLVTFCPMCYNTLKESNQFFDIKENMEKINIFLEREKEFAGGVEQGYKGGIEVLNFLEVLRDTIGYAKIAKEVKKPLKDLKVSTYYGCLVLRPREIGIDDPENPTILENILEALGAEMVDNPNRTECCGSYHTVDRKDLVAKLTYDNLIYPIRNGADVIVTCCPLCTFNLDYRQKEARKIHRELKEIPVLYYTQLMAIAFGLDKKFFGVDLDLHKIDPKPLLKAKNLY
jgi:heterodisulfide reductase subunit B